jgi:hypothetical protein
MVVEVVVPASLASEHPSPSESKSSKSKTPSLSVSGQTELGVLNVQVAVVLI